MSKILMFGFVSLMAGAVLASGKGAATVNIVAQDSSAEIILEGKAAKTLFDALSNDLIETIDASESPSGNRLVYKIDKGNFVNCYMEVAKKNKYNCQVYTKITVNSAK